MNKFFLWLLQSSVPGIVRSHIDNGNQCRSHDKQSKTGSPWGGGTGTQVNAHHPPTAQQSGKSYLCQSESESTGQ